MFTQKLTNPIVCCFMITALFLQISCKMYPPTDLTKENIIPKPVSVTASGESGSRQRYERILFYD